MNSLVLPGERRWVDRNEIIFRRGQAAFGGETVESLVGFHLLRPVREYALSIRRC